MGTEREHGAEWSAQDEPSREELKRISEKLQEFESDFGEMLSRLEPITAARLRELAGPHLAKMLESDDVTRKCLSDDNPKLREAAVQLLCEHWEPSSASLGIIEKMATSDPNEDVRDTAMRALGTCYKRTKDRRIGHLLAATARNHANSDSLRLTAFMSLLRVHGLLDYATDYAGKSPVVPVSLQEVDWQLVEDYFRGGDKG
jgi:hypothetical protein